MATQSSDAGILFNLTRGVFPTNAEASFSALFALAVVVDADIERTVETRVSGGVGDREVFERKYVVGDLDERKVEWEMGTTREGLNAADILAESRMHNAGRQDPSSQSQMHNVTKLLELGRTNFAQRR